MPEAMDGPKNGAGSLEFCEYLFTMRIRTTVQPMYKAVDTGPSIENVDGTEDFTRWCEVDFNWVIHPATTVTANVGPGNRTREYIRTFAGNGDVPILIFEFMSVVSIAPVQSAVRSEETTVDASGVTRKTETVDNNIAFVGDAVTSGISESPNIWGRGDVQRTIVPDPTHWECHFVGKYGAFVKLAIAIEVFE
jgi:hypothetical protein